MIPAKLVLQVPITIIIATINFGNLAILVSVDTNTTGAEYFIPGEGSPGNYCISTKL